MDFDRYNACVLKVKQVSSTDSVIFDVDSVIYHCYITKGQIHVTTDQDKLILITTGVSQYRCILEIQKLRVASSTR